MYKVITKMATSANPLISGFDGLLSVWASTYRKNLSIIKCMFNAMLQVLPVETRRSVAVNWNVTGRNSIYLPRMPHWHPTAKLTGEGNLKISPL